MEKQQKIMFSGKEVLETFKISHVTLARWRAKGMPHYRFSRTIRYEYYEILNWLKEQKENAVFKKARTNLESRKR